MFYSLINISVIGVYGSGKIQMLCIIVHCLIETETKKMKCRILNIQPKYCQFEK